MLLFSTHSVMPFYSIRRIIRLVNTVTQQQTIINRSSTSAAQYHQTSWLCKYDSLLEAVRVNNTDCALTLLGHYTTVEHDKNTVPTSIDSPIEASDEHGDTPLILAARNGNFTLVMALLQDGANINAQNNAGETAHDEALTNEHYEITHELEMYSRYLQEVYNHSVG